VIGGIAAVATLIALTLFVLIYARSGALHGDRFRLFVAGPDANNLLKGSEVWLNGQRVGVVRNIAFNDPSAPPDLRVVIETEVLTNVRPLIRLDSRATLRSGGTVIGAPVVYITAGSRKSRGVVPDDTLRSGGSPDLELAASKFTESMEEVPTLLADSRQVMADTKIVGNRLSVVLAAKDENAAFLKSATALIGKFRGRGFGARLSHTMAAVDSLHVLLTTRMDEVGRFRRDSSLAPSVRALRADVAQLRDMASSPDGTIGRTRADSALRRELDSAFAELNTLLADIKKHPLKYSKVF
jgi:ABC-type transporter Mla subunit MlaD